MDYVWFYERKNFKFSFDQIRAISNFEWIYSILRTKKGLLPVYWTNIEVTLGYHGLREFSDVLMQLDWSECLRQSGICTSLNGRLWQGFKWFLTCLNTFVLLFSWILVIVLTKFTFVSKQSYIFLRFLRFTKNVNT